MKALTIALIVATCATVGWAVGVMGVSPAALLQSASTPTIEQCDDYSGLPDGDAMIALDGGEYIMAAGNLYPEEGQPRKVSVNDFRIDLHEVTNAQFAEFVEATGYTTVAERQPDPAMHPNIDPSLLVPGGLVFDDGNGDVGGMGAAQGWWKFMPGANWRQPYGPASSIEGKENFPVVQVTMEDARAYAKWKGHRIPTEQEWEFAARGGLSAKRYAWGEQLKPENQSLANIWQGTFPQRNTGEDGYRSTSKVGCFAANGYGLVDMIGNVWELTDSPYVDVAEQQMGAAPQYVIKGGSYLCAENYCRRYRPAARQGQEADLGSTHVGFRTVAD